MNERSTPDSLAQRIRRQHDAIIVGCGVVLFLLFKLLLIVPRFGDGNAYFYMAQSFLNGILPYRDFFFADAPILLLILTGTTALTGGSIFALQVLPLLFEAASALLIFALMRHWRIPLPWVAPLAWLFSFSVLATVDYVTGVQVVVFFVLAGLLLWEKNRPVFSGICWALAILTKGYALPALLGLAAYGAVNARWRKTLRLVFGAAVTGIVVLGPFLLIAAGDILHDIFIHHLNRPEGIPASQIFSFYIQREWLILLLAIPGLWFLRKTPVPWLAGFSLAFLLWFPDLYYLYLNSVTIYAVIATAVTIGVLWKLHPPGWTYALGAVYVFFVFFSISHYVSETRLSGMFLNVHEIADYTRQLPESYPLYGSHEITPLVALLSDRPLFGNYIDTNTQTFASGAHNVSVISREAVSHGVYLVAEVHDHPEHDIFDFGFDRYFSRAVFETHCTPVARFPSTNNISSNGYIALYECVE